MTDEVLYLSGTKKILTEPKILTNSFNTVKAGQYVQTFRRRGGTNKRN